MEQQLVVILALGGLAVTVAVCCISVRSSGMGVLRSMSQRRAPEACAALPASFARDSHSRLVLVVGDVDTHFGGVVRILVVGRLSFSPVVVRKSQRYRGNSAEEGANSAKTRLPPNFATRISA